VGKEDTSIPEMVEFLRHQLARSRREALSAMQLFERQRSRRAMICLFLAILELVKRQAIELTQGEAFGDIGLRRGPGFDELRDTAEELATVEKEYH
jgi:segregation and condensation protein A